MMATVETQQQYEGAILSQLIKNAERQAVFAKDISQLQADVAQLKSDVAELKSDVAQLKSAVVALQLDMAEVKLKVQNMEASLNSIKWLMATIALGILVNIFSQPILSALHMI